MCAHGVLPVRRAVDIEVRRGCADELPTVRMAGVPLGSGEAAFRRLERRLAVAVHAGAGWTGRIDAGAEVPHRDVVRCLDAVRAAGIDAVTFQGAPPGRSR